jgi:hypothetical protein
MVEITIMIEGGAPDSSSDIATVENTESLRESFHRIFSESLGYEVKIRVQPLGGYRNAARIFSESTTDVYLFVDLDDKKENIPNWFEKLITENPLKPIEIPASKKPKVFFMIQEMEAWILKQPEAIENWGLKNHYVRKHPTEKIADHSLISRKNIEDLAKPSVKLNLIIKHFFRKEYRGKKKIIQYGKLKTAPDLLDCLDVSKLKATDSEFNRFSTIF